MSNILLAVPTWDRQSGLYIHDSLIQLGHKVATFDWRAANEQGGRDFLNEQFIEAHKELKPDLTIVIKGLGLTGDAVKAIKEFHKNPIVTWIFDVTLGGTYVKDVAPYVKFIKNCDMFYTIDASALPELEKMGVKSKWLTEGCYEKAHKSVVFNSIQKRKFGSDVVFLGSVGMIHPNREKVLSAIHEAGFDLSIYGDIYYPEGEEPAFVKECHTGFAAINDQHSLICQASKVVIGVDGWPDREKSMSARVYRTLCSEAFLLTNHTVGADKMFNIGKHLDTFKDNDELMEKLVYWLSNDSEREEVAKAGQKFVLENCQFKHRLAEILEDFKI